MNAYVVMKCYYDYGNSSEIPILVTFDENKAKQKCQEMVGRLVLRNESEEKLLEHMAAWRIIHPQPKHQFPKEKILPDFGPKKSKWSKEQLAEYELIKQTNRSNQMSAMQPIHDWVSKSKDEEKLFKSRLSAQVLDDLDNLQKTNTWEVIEIPFKD